MKSSLLCLFAALACTALLSTPSSAKIKAMTLPEMVNMADDAVVGQITQRDVFRVDHPIDGPELYYTTLSIQGRSLVDGSEKAVQVTFPGGFIDATKGVFNSEAPEEHEIEVGKEVVVFHGFEKNMGGDVSGEALLGSHGGLFSVVSNGKDDKIVLGRGVGYPVSENVRLDALDEEITLLAKN